MTSTYPTEPVVQKGPLPDPFLKPDGTRISDPSEWPEQAGMWRDKIIEMEYGGMPPKPESIEIETLCHASVRRWEGAPHLWSYRVTCKGGSRPFTFSVRIVFPSGPGPFPAIIHGDGCWWYLAEEVAQKALEAGCAVISFNRTEFAEDLGYDGVQDKHRRAGGLYEVYPGMDFGALAAWAWGYHRCVDLLMQLPFMDHEKIAITGHSRGGKTVLIAGATDERITLIADNASCAGGSAAFRYVGHGGETLDILNSFPTWFGPGLRPYLGRENEIPFDQHCLLATIAPRALLLTYALADRWSNPEGMVQCAWAASEVYRFLGAPDNLAFHLREGDHTHAPEDWAALLDFIRTHWYGETSTRPFNQHPYSHLKRAFGWKAPGV